MKINIPLLLICIIFLTILNKSVKAQKPNFVIIMADDLGYGDISCYGNKKINTPNIDLLAEKGVKFVDFHSNGAVCSPTRAALMTGKYQQRTGVEGVITAASHRETGLSLDEITIAEELKKYNYNCGIFGKWHLGYPKEFNPTLQGFDQYAGFVSGNIDYIAHIDQEGFADWWKGTKLENEEGYSTDLITNYGVKFIKDHNPKNTNKPFFLYLPHEAPHGPYQGRNSEAIRTANSKKSLPINKDSIQVLYKEMIEVMDEGIGKVVEALKETGQYNNTIIVFLSDNGGTKTGSNGVLRGEKASPYEGGSRVPAVISYPNKIKGGIVNTEIVLTMDLLPTFLDFIGQKPSGKNVDGISIKENLLNQTKLPLRDLFFSYQNRSFIRSGEWKLITIKTKEGDKVELYNLKEDISELNNLNTTNLELVNKLKLKLDVWGKDVREGVKLVSEY